VVVKGVLDFAMFVGEKIEARVRIGKLPLLVYLPNTISFSIGSELELVLPWRNIIVLPSE